MIHTSEILIRAFEHVKNQRYGGAWQYCDLDIKVDSYDLKLKQRTNKLRIRVSQMYEHVDFDFSFLQLLSDLCKTKKINVGDRYSSPGCDTCDHGSDYSCTIRIDDAQDIYVDAFTMFPARYTTDPERPSVMIRKEYRGKLVIAPEFKKIYDRVAADLLKKEEENK